MSTIERTQLINRELSWLSFNARVLQEANDKSVPLIEREIKHKKQGKES
jgi:polyphosphate kinase